MRRTPMLPILRFAIAAAAWLAAAVPAAAQEREPDVCNVRPERAELDFTLPALGGGDVTLSEHAGQVILLDFWATWCAPCREEIPDLVELYEEYRDEGFVVLGVSVDDSVSELVPYVAELGMTYPVLIGDGRYDLRDAYGPLMGFPTSFLITRDEKVCVRHVGIASKEQFEREIAALL